MLPMIIAVKWVDARYTEGIQYPEEFRTFSPITLWDVGWGFQKEDGTIVLANTYSPLGMNQSENYRHASVIPKECIKEVIILEAKEKME